MTQPDVADDVNLPGLDADSWGELAPRWGPIETRWREVGPARVRTLVVEGTEPGPTHLLVHGLGGSATNWIEVLPGLGAAGRAIAVDLPGFGETPPPRPTAVHVPAQAAFIGRLVRDLGPGPVILHGNSMGGLISLLAAGRRPHSLAALALVAPATPARTVDARHLSPVVIARFAPFLSAALGKRLLDAAWDRASDERIYSETVSLVFSRPDALDAAIRRLGEANIGRARELEWRHDAFARATRSLVAMHITKRKVLAAMDRVDVPTHVIWGEDDKLVSRHAIGVLEERRPDWGLDVFEGVGHAPMLEAPGRYLDVVRSWLKRTDSERLHAPGHGGQGAPGR